MLEWRDIDGGKRMETSEKAEIQLGDDDEDVTDDFSEENRRRRGLW